MKAGERIKFAENAAKKLATEICPQGLDDNALPSLNHACNELQRLQLD
jgi:hypothetical protein